MEMRLFSEPWVTDVPLGTTDDVIRVLVEACLIDDVGERTARQRWKKPLTFGLAHAIRTGAIPPEVVQVIYTEARRMLKGTAPMTPEELRETVRQAFSKAAEAGNGELRVRVQKGRKRTNRRSVSRRSLSKDGERGHGRGSSK